MSSPASILLMRAALAREEQKFHMKRAQEAAALAQEAAQIANEGAEVPPDPAQVAADDCPAVPAQGQRRKKRKERVA